MIEEKRINGMIESIMKVTRGDYSAQIELSGKNDEFDSLAMGLNMMIDDIRTNEEELRIKDSAIASSINAIALADLEGNLTYVNPSFLELWGYDDDKEVLGKSAIEFWQMGDKAAEIVEALRNTGGWKGELLVRRKNGSAFDAQLSANIVIDEQGKPIRMMASSVDITERKRMEEKIKQTAEEWNTTFDSITDLVSISDKDFRLIRVNKAFADTFKKKPEELVGKTCYEVVHGTNEPVANCPQKKTIRTKKPATAAFFEPRLGIHLEVSTSPVFNEEGQVVAAVHIAKDITERKRLEEERAIALAEVEQTKTVSEVVEAMGDALLLYTLDGKITFVNPACEKMTGYAKSELVGTNIADVGRKSTKPEGAERTRAAIETALKGEVPTPVPLTLVSKEGRETPVAYTVSFMKDAKGKRTTTIVVLKDITELKKAEKKLQIKNEQLDAQNEELQASEEELRASNEELKEAQEQIVRSERLAAIGQLAGGVGHELRNPLGAIKNAVYYIKGKVAKSDLAAKEPRLLQFLDIVDEEVNSSNKIISDLLNFSRVGKPAVSPARIENVIEDALSRLTIPEELQVVKELDGNLPELEIDTDQIRLIFMNVITNAVQAMPEGGKLTIDAHSQNNFLEIDISDTGHGIPKENLGKLFEPLFTTRAKGIGLGLAVCKAIVERHEGQIEVKSEEGKGTTFTIKLPLKSNQSSSDTGGK